MKRALFVVMASATVFAASLTSASGETKTGAAKFTGTETVSVALGDKLKLNATFKVIPVGPASAVSVGGTLKNTAPAKLNYAYHVAFLDKDKNLIGCQHYALFIDAGKQMNVGTFIQLPPEQIARIAYYSVALYESEKLIGSK